MARKTLLTAALFTFLFSAVSFAQDKTESITIIDASVCQSIEDREPVDVKDVFSSDIEKIYCYTKAGSLEKTKIQHIWYYKDTKLVEIDLKIGASPGWRTRSSKTIMPHQTGNWKVEIVSASGKVLKTIRFLVE